MSTVRYVNWRGSGETIVPMTIERRYCPKNDGHWDVNGERCRACNAQIKTDTYERTETK